MTTNLTTESSVTNMTSSCEDCDVTTLSYPGDSAARTNWLHENLSEFIGYYNTITCLLCLVPGLIGNSLAFVIMLRDHIKASTHIYLCALSAIDNAYLLVYCLLQILYQTTDGAVNARKLLDCNLTTPLIYVTHEISSWLLVIISAERALVVFLPARAPQITRVRNAKAVIGALVAIICTKNWFRFGGLTGVVTYRFECRGRVGWLENFRSDINPWIDSAVYSYIPTVLLIIINTALITKFLAVRRKVAPGGASSWHPASTATRSKVTQSTGVTRVTAGVTRVKEAPAQNKVSLTDGRTAEISCNNTDVDAENSTVNGAVSKTKSRGLAKHSRRLTMTAILLSLTFLLLTVPNTIHKLYYFALPPKAKYDMFALRWWRLFYALLSSLELLNHAINILLYCLTGSKFRNNLRKIIRCSNI